MPDNPFREESRYRYYPYERLPHKRCAIYKYAGGGVFFRIGDEETANSNDIMTKPEVGVWVFRIRLSARYYFVAQPGDVTIGARSAIDGYLLDVAFSYPNDIDTPMPDILIRQVDAPEIVQVSDVATPPRYYREQIIRTDGIDRYDPEHAVDPNAINPSPTRMGGRRALVQYDDKGNIISTKKDGGPAFTLSTSAVRGGRVFLDNLQRERVLTEQELDARLAHAIQERRLLAEQALIHDNPYFNLEEEEDDDE